MFANALLIAAILSTGAGFPERFADPPREFRPWTYWWWQNGNVSEEDITRDLEAIEKTGFGGVLMFDNRNYGYTDGVPPVKHQVMTDPWFDLVAFSIRECARIGLEFEMNASSSGGSLCGFADGKFYEVDITDPYSVSNHLDRFVGPVIRRVPELVGKTFTHIYSVSWEGKVPQSVDPARRDAFILKNFYGTMRGWAHAHGLKMSSESGGPWHRTTGHFAESDQLAYLGVNDLPQGEFWPQGRLLDWCRPMHLVKPVASAARARGLNRVSAEAFTHMTHHWSMDPASLKPSADEAFIDGANHLVWHTFTCSPERFGVPGTEYFAGTHINRNVTWHDDAPAFVRYLARCQYMLQYGEPVADLAVNGGDRPYLGWGHHRLTGHDWDLLSGKDYASLRRVGDRLSLPSGRSYPAVLPPPDCVDCGGFAHRRHESDDVDVYFVKGPVFRGILLRAPIGDRRVELWDPVTGSRTAADAKRFRDGRTSVVLDLAGSQSVFVVFLKAGEPAGAVPSCDSRTAVKGPWEISFSYHRGVKTPPPAPLVAGRLFDFTENDRLRHFSGAATYRTSFDMPVRPGRAVIRLGGLPSGLARVTVNGRDCGTVWCEPWEADVTGAVRAGSNGLEIRYVNSWHNRLVGDAALPPAGRVTRTTIRMTTEKRDMYGDEVPYSKAISAHDPLIPSGVLGPVEILHAGEGR